jgi:1-deoxy-D-xylulose-5-phosphate synthase
LSVLTEAKTREKPVFIHLHTQKGKGYEKAEQSDLKYHSVGSFDIDEGECKPDYNSFSSNFGEKICEAAKHNAKICAVTAAMTEGTGLENFRRDYPERFFDVGIAESHAAVFAAGLAAGGFVPVFAVYSSFMQRAYDNIIHDIALQNLHVIFCVDRAGLCGEDGATHHGMFDAAFLNHAPNINIYSPASYAEFNGSFDFCVNKLKAPAFIRYPKGAEDAEFNKSLAGLNCENNLDYIYKKNNGAQFLLISYGQISRIAYQVFEKLNKNNKTADFLKLNKIKPLDYILPEIIKSGAENIIFIEEGIENGGVSQLIASKLNNKQIKIFALSNFIGHGSNEELFELCGFNAEKIYNNIINDNLQGAYDL